MLKIHQKLAAIQTALKAPKSQYNEFGKYKYRKAEDILEAVKPLLADMGCSLTCTDELILVGSRYYIKATATITDVETGDGVSTTAYAREEEEKKGMDGSQVTGASSSYARKYALNGLLCIDDTADSDTTNVGDGKATRGTTKKPTTTASKTPEKVTQTQKVDNDTADLLPGGKTYAKIVAAFARGLKTKKGDDYRTAWITATGAGQDLQEVFDHDVASYRLNNNIKPAFDA